MANYAIITGIDIEFQDQGRLVGCAYKNTLEIHKFLCSIGYDTIRMFGSRETKREILDELKWVRGKLKRGDKFLFYYYGRAAYTHTAQYIVLDKCIDTDNKKNSYISINLIKQITDIRGVERIIMLDTYQVAGGSDGVNGLTDGINKTLIKTAMDSANSKSPKDTTSHFPVGYYFVYNNRLPPDGDSVFAKAVLANFTRYARYSLGISFPSICKSISESFKKQVVAMLPEDSAGHPCFEGDKVVLLSQGNAVSRNSKHLSAEQKKIKREADLLLELAFRDHETWLERANRADVDNDRLSWGKLASILEMYESAELDPPALTCRQIDEADFSSARILNGLDFSGSSFFHCSFRGAKLDRVNFSKCLMSKCDLTSLHAVQCDFSYLNLFPSHCDFSDFIGCCFQNASLGWSHFNHCILDVSSFLKADVSHSFFLRCLARRTDFTDANLEFSVLSQTDFSGASLTGSKLYGTARTEWRIQDVKCRYVFWDQEGKERFPSDNDFDEGEFTTQYRDYKMFSYTFSEGITPLDLMLATHIVEEINKADMGFRIKIDSASLRGLNPTLNFIMESEDDEKREEAQKLFKTIYEQKIALLEEKLKNSGHLLEERTRRADLAEEQLSEMTAVVKQTFSGEKFGVNARQLLVEHLFTPLMTELFKDGGLMSQYSANKSKNLSQLGPDDLADYRYIALFRAGSYADDLSKQKLDILHTELRKFMRNECLVVLDSELADTKEDSYIRSVYSIFNPPPEMDAYIAVGTVFAEEKLFTSPVYREINWHGHDQNSFQIALSQNLRELRVMLTDATLDQFPLPPLPPGAQPLQFANGTLIASKLNSKGIVLRETNTVICPDTGGNLSCHRETISKAKTGDLVLPSTLKYLSCLLGVPEPELMFTRIVPNKQHVCAVRKILASEARKEARDWFGPFSDFFFEQIEMANDIPAQCMKFIYHHYKKLFETNRKNGGKRSKKIIEPLALIDTDKTLALHVRLQQGQSR